MLIKEEQNNAKVNVVSYKAVEGDSVFYSVKKSKKIFGSCKSGLFLQTFA